jgi:general secretion pathway protein D
MGESSPLFGALRVIPIERINAVLVITPRAAYLDEVRYWIERFDQPNVNSTEPQLFVYKVQNGSADHLAELLNGIYGATTQTSTGFSGLTGVAPGLTSAGGYSNVNNSFASQFGSNRNQFGTGGTGGFGTGGTGGFGSSGASAPAVLAAAALAPAAASAAVVSAAAVSPARAASASSRRRARPQRRHHHPGRQRARHGRPHQQHPAHPRQRGRIPAHRGHPQAPGHPARAGAHRSLHRRSHPGRQPAIRPAMGLQRRPGPLRRPRRAGQPQPHLQLQRHPTPTAQTSDAFTYSLSNGSKVAAVLTALAKKSLVKVMSSPSLMVLDNHTAAFQVGDQVPINTGTTQSGAVTPYLTTNIQYKDTGVMLGVTPSVSAGDLVTLDINQMVTNIGPDSSSVATAGYPTFMQRQINSKVAVRSGETLVLGGLIKDSNSNGKSGLPILSSIPVLGALFGQHKNNTERTEMLVILTPRVLRSDEDARAVSRELRDRMQGLLGSGALGAALPAATTQP